jgi:hypothetical protein
LDAKEHDNEYEQKIVDWHIEQRVDNIIGPLEVSNANDFAKDYIPLIERGGVDLASDPSHDKHGADCFMYSFVDSQEDEFANQLVEEKVDVPRFSLLDDIAYVVDFPIYDEYDDDYDVDFLEQPVVHVLYQKMFLFSSVMRAINLHITVTKKKVLNQLKEIIYLYAFLYLNC